MGKLVSAWLYFRENILPCRFLIRMCIQTGRWWHFWKKSSGKFSMYLLTKIYTFVTAGLFPISFTFCIWSYCVKSMTHWFSKNPHSFSKSKHTMCLLVNPCPPQKKKFYLLIIIKCEIYSVCLSNSWNTVCAVEGRFIARLLYVFS